MPTYNGWTVITIPSYPPAPASFEFTTDDAAAFNISPFTGQQQLQYWGVMPKLLTVTFPPVYGPNISNWTTFLTSLNGVANVFQFSSAFGSAYPEIGTRYWRLKQGKRKWGVTPQRVYMITLDLIEAK